MKQILISVITVSYNAVDSIEETILSVINQTYTNVEYIIVDGGSSDGTVDIIKKHESRISYWISEADNGIYNAMNKGISLSHGDYLLFLNAGDFLYSTKVFETVFMNDISADIISCTTLGYRNGKLSYVKKAPKVVTLSFFIEDSLSHPATLIKRTLFQNFLYDESKRIVSDWKFFIEALILHNCTYQKFDLISTIFDLGGVSSIMQEENQKERRAVLMELFPMEKMYNYDRKHKSRYWQDRIRRCFDKYTFLILGTIHNFV